MISWDQHARSAPPRHGKKPALSTLADALRVVTDASLAALVFVAPLFLGGRHDFGRFVFVVFIAIASVAWFVRQAVLGRGAWTRRGAHWLFLAAATLLVIQLAPLSADGLQWLSPRTAALLPLWTGAIDSGELGRWNTLSLNPELTRHSVAMLAAYAMLFATVSQRIEHREDVWKLLRWIGVSAAAIALIALLQAALPNGKFLWIYEHPSETTFDRLSGPFANRNHFAHFLILGAAPLAAWWATSIVDRPLAAQPREFAWSRRNHRPYPDIAFLVPAILLLITVATVLLSASRGGAVTMLVASIALAALLWRRGLLQSSRWGLFAAAGGALLLAIPLFNYGGTASRLTSLTSASIDEVDEQGARRKIWAANAEAIKSGGLFGSGAGSHRDIYPLYLTDPPTKEHTHAESGYLQVVTETGVCGGLLLSVALLMGATWCVRALRRADCPESFAYAAAITAALIASATHSIVDFVWYIPACLTSTLIVAACAMRLGELNHSDTAPRRQLAFSFVGSLNLAAAVALVAVFSMLELFGPAIAARHWDAYLRTSNDQRDFELKLLSLPLAEGARAREESGKATEAALESMISLLEQSTSWRPSFAAAHRQLANRYLELYHLRSQRSDNPMPAPQVRDAAIASQFRSSSELRSWLRAAFGSNSELLYDSLEHARIAAQLSPLQGAPYVRLAALGFLQGRGHDDADAYLQQALTVRPYDGDLQFEVGADLCGRGQIEAGLECWMRALRIRGPHRIKVARAVAGSMPFANLTELFQPEWDTLPEFWKAYRLSDATNVAAFMNYAVEQTRREAAGAPPQKAAILWRRLAQIQLESGRPSDCIASLQASRAASPDDYSTRRMLGMVLIDVDRPEEAAVELQWCLDRRPDDARVCDVLAQIIRDRLASQGARATAAR